MQTFKDAIKWSHLRDANTYVNNFVEKLEYIHTSITAALNDYENFEGITFSDVLCGGIQICGKHKEIKAYTFGQDITLKYDLSNIDDAIDKFIKMWKSYDNNEYVSNFKRFIEFSERYGWD